MNNNWRLEYGEGQLSKLINQLSGNQVSDYPNHGACVYSNWNQLRSGGHHGWGATPKIRLIGWSQPLIMEHLCIIHHGFACRIPSKFLQITTKQA